MKKTLPNSTKMKILLIVLVGLLMGVTVNAQTWTDGIYAGDVLPKYATPAWAVGDSANGVPVAVYSIVADAGSAGNNLLYETTSATGDKKSYKLSSVTQPLTATWIIRTKAGNTNAVGTEFEINAKDNSSVVSRFYFRLVNYKKGGFVKTNYLTTNVIYPLDSTLDVKSFHTYRITVDNGINFKVYLDENATPIISGTGTTTTNTHFLRIGDVGSNFTEGYTDWMAWDVTGAYAPGTTLPAGVIVDGAGTSTSNDATLKDLQVGGTTITGFAVGTTTYNVVLPAGTTTVPTITATVNEAHATTVITQAPSVTGAGTVAVTAQDGTTKQTYTVNFSVAAALSTDATLSALTLDVGTLSPVFAAGTITYSVVLPAGTITVPTISATVTEAHATTVITQAPSVTGAGTVVVTAQDGTTKITYTVNFSVAAPVAPVASAATSVAKTSFSANWAASTGATGYYLDVATDNAFTAFVSGFNNKDVVNVTTFSVTPVTAATTYYYRVRAYSTVGTSASSNSITVLSLGTLVPSLTGDALKIAVSANSVNLESANSSIIALQVVDVNGKLIVEKNIGETSATVSTEGWSSGIYVLTIQTKDGAVTRKIGIVK